MPQNLFRPRDLEILRTLCRLRHVTGRELRAAFFGSDDPGRKRLKLLSSRMVIAPHSKGLPPATNYRAWRLTARGLDLVSRQWPWEPTPDGLVERAAKASLYNLYHREAINSVYLDYLRGSAEPNSAADPEAMTERANSLLWYPDGDCVLRYERQGRSVELVPDGVATARHRSGRVFIEVDRSSKTLSRIRENLERYVDYLRLQYTSDFPDERAPHVLYVVRSASRRSHLTSLFKQVFAERFEWQVLLFGKTTHWLEATLLGDKAGAGARETSAPALPAKTAVHDIAVEALRWTNGLLSRLKRRGMLDALDREDPTFFDDGQRTLLHLYRELGMGDAS
jgi:hypothetical protein